MTKRPDEIWKSPARSERRNSEVRERESETSEARQDNQGNQGRQSGAPGEFIGTQDGSGAGQSAGETGELGEQRRQ